LRIPQLFKVDYSSSEQIIPDPF